MTSALKKKTSPQSSVVSNVSYNIVTYDRDARLASEALGRDIGYNARRIDGLGRYYGLRNRASGKDVRVASSNQRRPFHRGRTAEVPSIQGPCSRRQTGKRLPLPASDALPDKPERAGFQDAHGTGPRRIGLVVGCKVSRASDMRCTARSSLRTSDRHPSRCLWNASPASVCILTG